MLGSQCHVLASTQASGRGSPLLSRHLPPQVTAIQSNAWGHRLALHRQREGTRPLGGEYGPWIQTRNQVPGHWGRIQTYHEVPGHWGQSWERDVTRGPSQLG